MLYCIIPYTWNAKLCHYIYNKLDLYIIFYFHFTFELGFMREKVIQLDIYSVPDRHAIGPPLGTPKTHPISPRLNPYQARQNPTHQGTPIGESRYGP